MSLINTNKLETNKYELTIKVDAESFAKAIDKAYKKNIKKINVPGFRQGKAPKSMVEKLYGEGVFFEDAINDLYPTALAEAIEEAKLEVVARPEVEMKTVEKADGFEFVAICIVKPEVEVKDYKGIQAEKTVKAVSEEDIDGRIDAMRNRNSRLVDVTDRAAQKGDTVVFDFDGYVDDVAFDGGKAEKFSLELGSGQFIPGFEEQIEGKKIEEEFDVNVTFPEEYQAEELKGKAATFKCKLHEIKGKELPELDDEFAKDVSEFDTLAELKADIKTKMQAAADKEASDAVENKLIDVVIENMTAEIPAEMNEARIDEMIHDFEYRLQSQGMNIDTYLQYTGMPMESFRQTFEEQAAKQVKIRLALEKIVELENISVAQEDIDAEYQKVADSYKMDVEKVKSFIPQADFAKDLAVNKAIDLIKENAVITEAK
ncbi:MAG: trigger factor [Oscillospiraceae bacterium]